tara:strand:- start:26 stop:1030 length:1005 start_codon:yes stop_codon:yes gene_type:complete
MIFVTGGTGLVGAHILLELSNKGEDFIALRRENSSLLVCEMIFKYYNAQELFSKINWHNGDINDIISLEEGMQKCDFVIHAAALVSFVSSDVDRLKKINIEGTQNIVNIALKLNIKKLAYVSSIATLGIYNQGELIDEETHFVASKISSNYALSKYYAEQEVWRGYAEGLDVVIVNPSVILGPGEWSKGSSQIFQKIYNGLPFYSTGSTGYVDVNDVAIILVKLLFSKFNNQRYILNAANLTYQECFGRIADGLNKPRAKFKVNNFLKSLAWRFEAVRYFISGKRPLITKETANSAITKKAYSNEKICKQLNYKFTDINLTIQKYCDWFIRDLG